MNFNELVRRYGDSDTKIANATGASRQLVAHWRKKGISKVRQAWLREKLRKVAQ